MLIGGKGQRRTPALAAQYADEFNLPFVDEDGHRGAVRRGSGRPARRSGPRPGELIFSNALSVCVGADEAEVARGPRRSAASPTSCGQNGLAGTPDEVLDKIGRYAALGSQRIYLQVLDLADLDHLRLVAADVLPQAAGDSLSP